MSPGVQMLQPMWGPGCQGWCSMKPCDALWCLNIVGCLCLLVQCLWMQV